MSNSKIGMNGVQNAFTYEDALGRIAVALAAHPFDYVKILIQLGYEPLPPFPVKTFFGRPRLALPGVFKYMAYIRRSDGFFGIYRGLSYKLMSTLVNGFVHVNANHWQKQYFLTESELNKPNTDNDSNGVDAEKMRKLLNYLVRETSSRFVALLLSYPFHVMTIRICAQFVGKEHHYDSLISSINDIYKIGGLSGFYVGFVPRFVGDCLILWVGSTIVFVVNSYIDSETGIKSYVSACVNFILSSVMYPFQLVSTVMCCNGVTAKSLIASAYTGPQYVNWIDCWKNLSQDGQLKRGASLLWRYQTHLTLAPHYQYKPLIDKRN